MHISVSAVTGILLLNWLLARKIGSFFSHEPIYQIGIKIIFVHGNLF